MNKKLFNLTSREFPILKRIEEKPITLEQLCAQKDLQYPKLKDLIYFIKHELIKKTKIRGKEETYSITDKGIKELKKKQYRLDEKQIKVPRPEKKPKVISKKDKRKAIIKDINQKKRLKTQDDEPLIKENWLEWTTPIYVEREGRWEFYKKQGETILEIYHSESEEELKEQHKEKVMSHIMGALKEEQDKPKAPQVKNKKERLQIEISPALNTSKFNHGEIMTKIMSDKLAGISYNETLCNIKSTYGLSMMTCGLYYSQVLEEIRERSKGIINKILAEHLVRYEELYQWFKENGYSKVAMKALERKERLMGFHDGENVEGGMMGVFANKMGGLKAFNWEQLSTVERERMMALVNRVVRVVITNKEEEK